MREWLNKKLLLEGGEFLEKVSKFGLLSPKVVLNYFHVRTKIRKKSYKKKRLYTY